MGSELNKNTSQCCLECRVREECLTQYSGTIPPPCRLRELSVPPQEVLHPYCAGAARQPASHNDGGVGELWEWWRVHGGELSKEHYASLGTVLEALAATPTDDKHNDGGVGLRERRQFPVMRGKEDKGLEFPCYVPWEWIEQFGATAEKNHSQTLERLAERGGLCIREIYAVMMNLSFRDTAAGEIARYAYEIAGSIDRLAATPTDDRGAVPGFEEMYTKLTARYASSPPFFSDNAQHAVVAERMYDFMLPYCRAAEGKRSEDVYRERTVAPFTPIVPATDRPEVPGLPRIVCLCGSTRFYKEYQRANYEETMAGRIVLSVGFYRHSAQAAHGETWGCTAEQKVALDDLHKRKIDLADEVLVVSVGGYIGESTRSEIEYAEAHDKPVRYWVDRTAIKDTPTAPATDSKRHVTPSEPWPRK